MTWTSFVNYVLMRELGQEDSIVRNYDLDYTAGVNRVRIEHAAKRLGYDTYNMLRAHIVPDIAQRLRNCGYDPPPVEQLEVLLNQWYNWDRIRTGMIYQWPKRKSDNPILGF